MRHRLNLRRSCRRARQYLGGRCTAFTAQVGVDNSQGTRGSVRFSVKSGEQVLAASPVLRNADPAHPLTARLDGVRYLDLVVDNGGDGNGNDHADWGEARLTC
nr:NPCBM/NEW2 domain-containing protein [Thermoactinospora rubra]